MRRSRIGRAVVLYEPGGPEALTLVERPIPEPEPGWSLVRVRAFGLNRSELMTRKGLSPGVELPRVLGIEAVGEVAASPGGAFAPGTAVASCMGGMGRSFDGGYADHALIPDAQLRAVTPRLPWYRLGAIPEMFQTAWGSLTVGLALAAGQRLLIRGGTASVGLAALLLAKRAGAKVTATTRDPAKADYLKVLGADAVLVDDGKLAEGGPRFDAALELVGTTTLKDTMNCVRRGPVCVAGMAGGGWSVADFAPLPDIPNGVWLTGYYGNQPEFQAMPLQEIVDAVADGTLALPLKAVYRLEEIVAAHADLEAGRTPGKIVVVTDPADLPPAGTLRSYEGDSLR